MRWNLFPGGSQKRLNDVSPLLLLLLLDESVLLLSMANGLQRSTRPAGHAIESLLTFFVQVQHLLELTDLWFAISQGVARNLCAKRGGDCFLLRWPCATGPLIIWRHDMKSFLWHGYLLMPTPRTLQPSTYHNAPLRPHSAPHTHMKLKLQIFVLARGAQGLGTWFSLYLSRHYQLLWLISLITRGLSH